MKIAKILLCALFFLINLAIAQPSWADKMSKVSPDYPVVVQKLNSLLMASNNPEQSGYTAEELQQKIAALQLQKQTLETSEDWASCRNETGRPLAIYTRKPEDSIQNSLYYLGTGQTTDEDWDCDAVYLPNDAQVAGLNLTPGEPALLKLTDGAQLIATTNPMTQEIQFTVSPALMEVLKPEQVTWPVPNLSQANIDIQIPNAPND
ncbi:hypothetical protein H6G76_24080 [Nostoc sp. FACHB-152]|uniref:hypothetical protein n=1 Tax=unclassified Nostoc TaxID=2593658 RepID=UPI0016896502|nr:MULTISPECIES: hypothetical protein [unclassified Nostoc]MBD2450182.1 hypothetical protein [Nostoc sp. FACHB-152]MBD2469005.1 hypothetical protein [Nostoc sp. FACHB-145]